MANISEYQQEENSAIISMFLQEHLHDPHWNEAIFILFGKLKRKPATLQLRQILEGNIRGKIEKDTDYSLQKVNLFFVCSCLIEEILVENDLAESVVLQLSSLLKEGSIIVPTKKTLETFGALMHTRSWAFIARQELRSLVNQNLVSNIPIKIATIITLFQNSTTALEDQATASKLLLQLAQHPDLPVRETIEVAESLSLFSPEKSATRQITIQLLLQLAQRSVLPTSQFISTALNLCRFSLMRSETRQFAIQLLLQLALRPDLPADQAIQAALNLSRFSPEGSEEREIASRLLKQFTQRPDFPTEASLQALARLLSLNYGTTEEQRTAVQSLIQLAQHSQLSVEQTFQTLETLSWFISKGSDEQQQVIVQLFLKFIQLPDIPIEQSIEAALSLCKLSPEGSDEQQTAFQLLLQLAQRSDVSVEQSYQAALTLYRVCSEGSKEEKMATRLLSESKQRLNEDWDAATIEQIIYITRNISRLSASRSEELEDTIAFLLQLAQNVRLASEKRINVIAAILSITYTKYSERLQAVEIVLDLLQEETLIQYIRMNWITIDKSIELEISDAPLLSKFVKEERLPPEIRNEMRQILNTIFPQIDQPGEAKE